MFDLGVQELVVIFAVALLVFGPKRLPELAKTLGKGVRHVRKAMFDIKAGVEREMEGEERGPGDEKPDVPSLKEAGALDVAEKGHAKEAGEAVEGLKRPGAGGEGQAGPVEKGKKEDRAPGA